MEDATPTLTRGQKAAATRAKNRALKAKETTPKEIKAVKPTPAKRVKKTTKPAKHSFTFVHKGETVHVLHEGNAWTVTTS